MNRNRLIEQVVENRQENARDIPADPNDNAFENNDQHEELDFDQNNQQENYGLCLDHNLEFTLCKFTPNGHFPRSLVSFE